MNINAADTLNLDSDSKGGRPSWWSRRRCGDGAKPPKGGIAKKKREAELKAKELTLRRAIDDEKAVHDGGDDEEDIINGLTKLTPAAPQGAGRRHQPEPERGGLDGL